MAQLIENPERISIASGLTDRFPTIWTFEDATEVEVSVDVGSGFVVQDWGVAYDLTVGDWLNVGADVVFKPGFIPVAGARVLRRRVTPLQQKEPFGDTERFRPEASEKAYDRLTRISQDMRAVLDRAIVVPFGETAPSSEDLAKAAEAGAIAAEAAALAQEAADQVFDKASRDGGNLGAGDKVAFRDALSAVNKQGDTFEGDVGAPRLIVRGVTFGGGDTSVLRSTILGGTEGYGAAVFNPASEAEWLSLAGVYQTREAVADYKEVGIRDGLFAYSDPLKAWNVPHAVTAYSAAGFTTAFPIPAAIVPGAYIQTLHAPWWAGKIASISPDRLTVTLQWGWVRQGQTSYSTPTNGTNVILNVVTRSWVANYNLMGEAGSLVESGVVCEFGVLNRRGNFVEGFNGNIGINDFSGIDVVSFANFVGNYGYRARSLKNGFLVEGTTGDGSGSGFRIKNTYSGATSFNPGYGFDAQQNDRIPFAARPELPGQPGVYNTVWQVTTTGNMDLGSQTIASPGPGYGRLRFHSAGFATPDFNIFSTGGSVTPNTGQGNYIAASHLFTGSQGHAAFLIGGNVGEGNYLRVDSSVGAAPAILSAQSPTADAGVIVTGKGGGSVYLNDGAGNTRIEVSNLGVGFFNKAPVLRQPVTGSTAGNGALISFLTALTNLGLITNSTTA